jgi:hypothetical protein
MAGVLHSTENVRIIESAVRAQVEELAVDAADVRGAVGMCIKDAASAEIVGRYLTDAPMLAAANSFIVQQALRELRAAAADRDAARTTQEHAEQAPSGSSSVLRRRKETVVGDRSILHDTDDSIQGAKTRINTPRQLLK